MTNTNSTWLCALIVTSRKIDSRDVTPAKLENFEAFIVTLSRDKLIALEDALEFAWDAMTEVDGEQAVELVREIGEMWESVFDLIIMRNFVESLIG